MNWNKAIAGWTARWPESYNNSYKMEAGPSSGHAFGHEYAADTVEVDEAREDLVGEPYAVVESDPGSFVLVALWTPKSRVFQASSRLLYNDLV